MATNTVNSLKICDIIIIFLPNAHLPDEHDSLFSCQGKKRRKKGEDKVEKENKKDEEIALHPLGAPRSLQGADLITSPQGGCACEN